MDMPKVKPLEWEQRAFNSGHYFSGIYEINPSSYEVFVYDCHIGAASERDLANTEPMCRVCSLEEAKAAAQADYETRILSALDLPTE